MYRLKPPLLLALISVNCAINSNRRHKLALEGKRESEKEVAGMRAKLSKMKENLEDVRAELEAQKVLCVTTREEANAM